MIRWTAALLLSLTAVAVQAAPVDTNFVPQKGPHPFGVHDLVMLDRVADAQLSPDGKLAAFTVRHTDYAKNKGVTGVYVLDLARGAPVQIAAEGNTPRWAPDGRRLYFLANAKKVSQLFWVAIGANLSHSAPVQATRAPLDLGAFKLSPDGMRVLLSYEVFTDCDTLACTQKRLADRAKDKATGTLYDRVFVRHWDTWADGRRNQLFVARLDARGQLPLEPKRVTRGIDGDVPSKPFGDDGEFEFAPDGKSVYFDVRIAGATEPWSTNFDVYRAAIDGDSAPENLTAQNLAWDAHPVPSPDGKTLYYLAMKTPGFESDRFAIMALDLASGARHEVDPSWDRSAGDLTISADGKTLYTSADDRGQHPLFAIDVATGKATQLVGEGTVAGFTLAGNKVLLARNDLKHPAELFLANADGSGLTQVTHFTDAALKMAKEGDFEFFTFAGANGESVQGFVVKPVDFQPGKTYPVAFLIHGGPQGAWDNGWSYRWNPQTYAGQGFAVVTVNFHGSTGYGQAFTNAISGDWGGKPLQDLELGWKAALAKYSFLDGDRACALGASYGGYMIDWLAGTWNTPWKCLVSHDGVFDARNMYYATEELWFEEKEQGGPQYEHPELYDKFDPLNHVKDWRVPMLIVQGGHDYRIPETQGIGAFTALQRRGIPSELLYFPDENHWVLKPHNSVMWHDTVNAWLKRWTSPNAAPGNAGSDRP